MNKYRILILSFIFGFILLFFQQSLFNNLFGSSVTPNLILILCIYLTLMIPESIVNFLVFTLGIFLDSSSHLVLGASSASFLIIYIILTQLSQRIILNSFFSIIFITFVSSILYSSIYLSITSQLIANFEFSISSKIFPMFYEAILTSLISPVIFFILNKLIIKK